MAIKEKIKTTREAFDYRLQAFAAEELKHSEAAQHWFDAAAAVELLDNEDHAQHEAAILVVTGLLRRKVRAESKLKDQVAGWREEFLADFEIGEVKS